MSDVIPTPDPDADSDEKERREEAQVHHLAGKLARTVGLQQSAKAFVELVRREALRIRRDAPPHATRLGVELLIDTALQAAKIE